jgi:hypothetical protein
LRSRKVLNAAELPDLPEERMWRTFLMLSLDLLFASLHVEDFEYYTNHELSLIETAVMKEITEDMRGRTSLRPAASDLLTPLLTPLQLIHTTHHTHNIVRRCLPAKGNEKEIERSQSKIGFEAKISFTPFRP